jgi:hypothetical protein
MPNWRSTLYSLIIFSGTFNKREHSDALRSTAASHGAEHLSGRIAVLV